MTICLLLLALSGVVPVAGEEVRTWTNEDGKTVRGVLKEKGDGWVKILIKSRVHRIELGSLSEADQKYVREAKLYKPVVMKVAPLESGSPLAARDDGGKKKLKLTLENVQGRKLSFRLIWIGQTGARGADAIHRVVDREYDDDGEFIHEQAFQNRSGRGTRYRGFVARLLNAQGAMLAQVASAESLLRFLDEADREDARNAVQDKRPAPQGPKRGLRGLIPDPD